MLILALVVFVSTANAQQFVGLKAYGDGARVTAATPVTGTEIVVTSATTVSSTFLNVSNTEYLLRTTCDQDTAFGIISGTTGTMAITSQTGVRLSAGTPEYFVIPMSNTLVYRAYSSTASCNAVRFRR